MLDNTWIPFRSDESGDDSEIELEEEPSELNTLNYGSFLVVSHNKLRARYNGPGQHANDVGAIQANLPVPSDRLVYYFEIEVKDAGVHGKIAVGFSDKTFKLSRQPGWELNSYGYHGDDGKKFSGNGHSGQPYGLPYGQGDVIGAGIILATQDVFFTRNGEFLDVAYHQVKLPLYPTVGLHSKGECVEANFGQRPFVFEVSALAHRERLHQHRRYADLPLPYSHVHAVVRQYLQHHAYEGTLAALDQACGMDTPGAHEALEEDKPAGDHAKQEGEEEEEEEEGSTDSMGEAPEGCAAAASKALRWRAEIRQLVVAGEVDAAAAALQERFPAVLQQLPSVGFHLHRQKFLELVKGGQEAEAVQYARTHLAPYRGAHPEADAALQEVLSVMEYEAPCDAPALANLLGERHREAVADAINAGILLCCLGMPPGSTGRAQSSLETLLCQMAVGHTELRDINGGQGEIFQLHKVTAL